MRDEPSDRELLRGADLAVAFVDGMSPDIRPGFYLVRAFSDGDIGLLVLLDPHTGDEIPLDTDFSIGEPGEEEACVTAFACNTETERCCMAVACSNGTLWVACWTSPASHEEKLSQFAVQQGYELDVDEPGHIRVGSFLHPSAGVPYNHHSYSLLRQLHISGELRHETARVFHHRHVVHEFRPGR